MDCQYMSSLCRYNSHMKLVNCLWPQITMRIYTHSTELVSSPFFKQLPNKCGSTYVKYDACKNRSPEFTREMSEETEEGKSKKQHTPRKFFCLFSITRKT